MTDIYMHIRCAHGRLCCPYEGRSLGKGTAYVPRPSSGRTRTLAANVMKVRVPPSASSRCAGGISYFNQQGHSITYILICAQLHGLGISYSTSRARASPSPERSRRRVSCARPGWLAPRSRDWLRCCCHQRTRRHRGTVCFQIIRNLETMHD